VRGGEKPFSQAVGERDSAATPRIERPPAGGGQNYGLKKVQPARLQRIPAENWESGGNQVRHFLDEGNASNISCGGGGGGGGGVCGGGWPIFGGWGESTVLFPSLLSVKGTAVYQGPGRSQRSKSDGVHFYY